MDAILAVGALGLAISIGYLLGYARGELSAYTKVLHLLNDTGRIVDEAALPGVKRDEAVDSPMR